MAGQVQHPERLALRLRQDQQALQELRPEDSAPRRVRARRQRALQAHRRLRRPARLARLARAQPRQVPQVPQLLPKRPAPLRHHPLRREPER